MFRCMSFFIFSLLPVFLRSDAVVVVGYRIRIFCVRESPNIAVGVWPWTPISQLSGPNLVLRKCVRAYVRME